MSESASISPLAPWFARVLVAVIAFGAVLNATPASADTGTVGVRAGAARFTDSEGDAWRPVLRLDGSFELVGPLQLGGYLQATAEDLPLSSPAIGVGLHAAVRPRIPLTPLRPMLEVSAGRHQIPLDQRVRESAWVTAVTVGLGIMLSDVIALEATLGHQWLFGLDDDSVLANRAWQGSIGVTFDIP